MAVQFYLLDIVRLFDESTLSPLMKSSFKIAKDYFDDYF